MSKELIDQLRHQIDLQHQEAIRALELISRYLSDTTYGVAEIDSRSIVENGHKVTIRDKVLGQLRSHTEGLTVDDLVALTGLDKARIRGVLYAPALKGDIISDTKDGIATYRLKQNSR